MKDQVKCQYEKDVHMGSGADIRKRVLAEAAHPRKWKKKWII